MPTQGDFRDLRRRGLIGSMPHRSMLSAARSIPTWILALQVWKLLEASGYQAVIAIGSHGV